MRSWRRLAGAYTNGDFLTKLGGGDQPPGLQLCDDCSEAGDSFGVGLHGFK